MKYLGECTDEELRQEWRDRNAKRALAALTSWFEVVGTDGYRDGLRYATHGEAYQAGADLVAEGRSFGFNIVTMYGTK